MLALIGFLSLVNFYYKNLQNVHDAALGEIHSTAQHDTPEHSSRNPNLNGYAPADIEKWVMENSTFLGYGERQGFGGDACKMWNDKSQQNSLYPYLQSFVKELEEYNKLLQEFNYTKARDVRKLLNENKDQQESICRELELHPDGLTGIFKSNSLSLTPAGYVEPILPPLRHPRICWDEKEVTIDSPSLFDMGYLIHDFAAMCRKLKPSSRIVLIDMGASLEYHENLGKLSPPVYLQELYQRFGLPFDHIYAFEKKLQDPTAVVKSVPENLLGAYHWFNVGVASDPNSKFNPLRILLQNFDQDDLVVIKLDIDTPSIEIPLANQLRDDHRFHKLVDHFYFEHHVRMQPISQIWTKRHSSGSIQDSIKLFSDLRKHGIAAHSWP
jgi:hypothetical protein